MRKGAVLPLEYITGINNRVARRSQMNRRDYKDREHEALIACIRAISRRCNPLVSLCVRARRQ